MEEGANKACADVLSAATSAFTLRIWVHHHLCGLLPSRLTQSTSQRAPWCEQYRPADATQPSRNPRAYLGPGKGRQLGPTTRLSDAHDQATESSPAPVPVPALAGRRQDHLYFHDCANRQWRRAFARRSGRRRVQAKARSHRMFDVSRAPSQVRRGSSHLSELSQVESSMQTRSAPQLHRHQLPRAAAEGSHSGMEGRLYG